MKKILAIMIIALVILSPFGVNATHDSSSAKTYLLSHSDNPWSTMALSFLDVTSIPTAHLTSINGSSALDYEAPILAITALGHNPRTFGSNDYIVELKNYYIDEQIGDPSTLNDDFFGILALISAGEHPNSFIIQNVTTFILSNQNSDGGWGFTTTSDSDTNMTAAAILALLASGIEDTNSQIQDAIAYLQAAQNTDGGFPYIPNGESDSASTAWVIWALNALNINPASWVVSNDNPLTYLQENQDDQGFFRYQSNSSEDAFSPVTTAYAVIALENRTIPVKILPINSPVETFSFRIEGSTETVCSGKAAGPSALDIIKNAEFLCGFTYEIEDTSYGPYLYKINDDEAQGFTGWLYLVNNISPPIGAADYQLAGDDSIIWYHGDFSWLPTELSLSADGIETGQATVATVEFFSNDEWSPLADAVVHYGPHTAFTGTNGEVSISVADGYYKVYAEKQDYIRSNAVFLKVGQPADATVDLEVNIENVIVGGVGTGKPDAVSFIVAPSSIHFGDLNPGSAVTEIVNIDNTGSTDIHVEASVNGDSLFIENLKVSDVLWKNFRTDLIQGNNQEVNVLLSVPSGYSGEVGTKTGQLTFWAMAQ